VRFLLLIIAILIIEMYLLIHIGGELGALPTIALVFITAGLGLWMLRQQSLTTLRKASFSMVKGKAPVREAAEGIILLIGGILLLIPGFFTDTIGFLCLLPPTRALFLNRFAKRMPEMHGQTRYRHDSHTIEGEWQTETEVNTNTKADKKRLPTSD